MQVFYQRETYLKVDRIKNNVVFFFWFFIAALVIIGYNLYLLQEQTKHF